MKDVADQCLEFESLTDRQTDFCNASRALKWLTQCVCHMCKLQALVVIGAVMLVCL